MAEAETFMGYGDVDAPAPAPAPAKPERPLTLNERKALNWFKDNSPTGPNRPGIPPSIIRSVLMVRGLIEIDPHRKRYDPISYAITDNGLESLRGHHG
ncbi:hypothetical protein [Bradyrhizobium sp. 1(2017)]|uniref:hypothetical protein n=1 Tax=Bradyrhizobium sp. 1(2017) TaxID=1404888 RepID=UPI00140F33FB|nr:hypothetical protein [Bradyrhizobium sp. 1(2017)]QIO34359.1 hypothetical protein HAP40_22445 [Bradyrhizobium sp. 1(2017)]